VKIKNAFGKRVIKATILTVSSQASYSKVYTSGEYTNAVRIKNE